MDELRQRIARGDYSVDSSRVAGSLVVKMRLIKLARRRIGARHRDGRSQHK